MNKIIDEYIKEERPTRPTPTDKDVLDEVTAGIKEYFDKALDKILLYKFEREQHRIMRKKWEDQSDPLAGKGPLDTYGAEHLARLFGMRSRPFLSVLRISF